MASCPTTPDHRCWDCAPTRRGRPFNTDGLHPGNPLEPRDPGPAVNDPTAFAAHWEGVTVTRSSPTFDGVQPNHDHFIVIPDAKRQAKASTSKKGPSASAARKALRASIPVTFA